MAVRIKQTKRFSVYEGATTNKIIVILGASGYLGQFLVANFVQVYHESHQVIGLGSKQVNFEALFEEFASVMNSVIGHGEIDMVINCAAISQPGECAKNPQKSDAINIPRHLIRFLNESPTTSNLKGRDSKSSKPLLIHLSTDQVYDGSSKSNWKETDETNPVNEYGATKVKAEQHIRENYPTNHIILRSSIIIGPNPPLSPLLNRTILLEFILNSLRASNDKPPSFFFDEYRCPVNVYDVVKAIKTLFSKRELFIDKGETFNLGGSQRLSRTDMPRVVSKCYGMDSTRIQSISAKSVNRGVNSPSDISMDSPKLENVLGWKFSSFENAVMMAKPLLSPS